LASEYGGNVDDQGTPQALGATWPTWPSKLLFDATPAHKAISVQ
jgi:para-nitrobenzyl esterase